MNDDPMTMPASHLRAINVGWSVYDQATEIRVSFSTREVFDPVATREQNPALQRAVTRYNAVLAGTDMLEAGPHAIEAAREAVSTASANGRPVYKRVPYITIQVSPREVVERPASPLDQRQYPREWMAYQAQRSLEARRIVVDAPVVRTKPKYRLVGGEWVQIA